MFVPILEATTSYLSYVAMLISLIIILSLVIKKGIFLKIRGFFSKNNLLYAAIVGTVAFLGSMSYSNIAMYEPCTLCWYQRILIFPQVALLWVGFKRKDQQVKWYSLPLLILALLISGYHWFIQLAPIDASGFCDFGSSCVGRYVFEYGFTSIPGMAFSASLLMLLLLFVPITSKKRVSK